MAGAVLVRSRSRHPRSRRREHRTSTSLRPLPRRQGGTRLTSGALAGRVFDTGFVGRAVERLLDRSTRRTKSAAPKRCRAGGVRDDVRRRAGTNPIVAGHRPDDPGATRSHHHRRCHRALSEGTRRLHRHGRSAQAGPVRSAGAAVAPSGADMSRCERCATDRIPASVCRVRRCLSSCRRLGHDRALPWSRPRRVRLPRRQLSTGRVVRSTVESRRPVVGSRCCAASSRSGSFRDPREHGHVEVNSATRRPNATITINDAIAIATRGPTPSRP